MQGNIVDRKRANRKRSKNLSRLKYENMKLAKELKKYRSKNEIQQETLDLVLKLERSLSSCANMSLYAHNGTEIELMTSITCNHKICNICNWSRQKKIRRKYFRWFQDNETLVRVTKNGKHKYTTITQSNKYSQKEYVLQGEIKYDLMHLTLTVPHSVNGWRGKIFYFDEIKRAFNFMRKTDDWLKWVYGGEYGVESTRNDKGYHIHIHSLLFVKRATQNRNELHKVILKIWNRLTISTKFVRAEFTRSEIESIKKGNKLLDDGFVKGLNPKGATFINLETIYTVDEKGNKKRYPEWNSEAMLKAVMETISYHFKPKMFSLAENSHDIESIVNILAPVYRQILYFKFGCLHGESSLNIKDDTLLEDFEEITEGIDEETGEIQQKQYFVAHPLSVYPKGSDDKITLRRLAENRIKVLKAQTGRGAIEELINTAYKTNKHI